jgi:hypothetical protein
MNKKAAIGLSMNALVVIILSIFMVVGGITLLFQLVGDSEDAKLVLDERTSSEIERLITSGEKVALPFRTADIERGNKHIFGIGVRNINSKDKFSLEIKLSNAVDENKDSINVIGPELVQLWFLFDDSNFEVEENEFQKIRILAQIPKDAIKGQYIFDATILNSEEVKYGNVQKIYVNVK